MPRSSFLELPRILFTTIDKYVFESLMQVAVTTRLGQGPVYGSWLPDPPKYGWWKVVFGTINVLHNVTVIPFLINISLPIAETIQQEDIWLVFCTTFYLIYCIFSWTATIRCNCFLLYINCLLTPVIVTTLFCYTAWRGHFIFKNSWKDQITLSIAISAFIVCTILRLISAIEDEQAKRAI